MIYTEMTILAARVAEQAHHGQYDKGGMPYIWHPLHLAEQMTNEYAAAVALLHDVMEDTAVPEALLASMFPAPVMEALRLLTHADGVPYMEYVAKIRTNEIARAVKLADLRHNLDAGRLAASGIPAAKQAAMREKYEAAYAYLSGD